MSNAYGVNAQSGGIADNVKLQDGFGNPVTSTSAPIGKQRLDVNANDDVLLVSCDTLTGINPLPIAPAPSNIGLSVKHLQGTNSISFDKTDTTSSSSGIYSVLTTPLDLTRYANGVITFSGYVTDPTVIQSVGLLIGDAALNVTTYQGGGNYGGSLDTGWNTFTVAVNSPSGQNANGCDWSNVSIVGVIVNTFENSQTFSGYLLDGISISLPITNRMTDAAGRPWNQGPQELKNSMSVGIASDQVGTLASGKIIICNCDVLGDAEPQNLATTIASTTNHIEGSSAIIVNKLSDVSETIASVYVDVIKAPANLDLYFDGIIKPHVYFPSDPAASGLNKLQVSLLTSGGNEQNYSFPVAGLTSGWNHLESNVLDFSDLSGNGVDWTDIIAVSFDFEFNLSTDTFSGMIIDAVTLELSKSVYISGNVPLPSGASTAANQALEITALDAIEASAALASTAAKQDAQTSVLTTIQSDLAAISAQLPPSLGPQDPANSLSVVAIPASGIALTVGAFPLVLTGAPIPVFASSLAVTTLTMQNDIANGIVRFGISGDHPMFILPGGSVTLDNVDGNTIYVIGTNTQLLGTFWTV